MAGRNSSRRARPVVVVAGLGDTGVMVATRLSRWFRVVAVTTRPALVSGQELGTRLVDPERWKRNYYVPLRRFRRLDDVEVHHGRITGVDLGNSTVHVSESDGSTCDITFDALVIATGVSNGFWRDDRIEDLDSVEGRITESARRLADARTIARTVCGSSLVKCAVHGRDPNWGRIVAAAGRAGVAMDAAAVALWLGPHQLMDGGQPLPFDRPAASAYLRDRASGAYLSDDTAEIRLLVGTGSGQGLAWGCDLSDQYVRINADYTT